MNYYLIFITLDVHNKPYERACAKKKKEKKKGNKIWTVTIILMTPLDPNDKKILELFDSQIRKDPVYV